MYAGLNISFWRTTFSPTTASQLWNVHQWTHVLNQLTMCLGWRNPAALRPKARVANWVVVLASWVSRENSRGLVFLFCEIQPTSQEEIIQAER